MGRRKPGKPRRPRGSRRYTLYELEPPGEGYEHSFDVRPGMRSDAAPRLSQEAVDLMERVVGLGSLYGGRVPKAALYLEELIEVGAVSMFRGQEGMLVPVEELAELMEGMDDGSVRESLHRLHAVGALLVFPGPCAEDVYFVRMAARRPERPGQCWQFVGDRDVVAATTCVPNRAWEELSAEVAAAVVFLRTCRARLEAPDPEVYGRYDGVEGPEHAKKLFAAALASGYVDHKGCDACPAGHLCTRPDA